MSSTAKVTVLGKKYPFRFGFKFQRLFMEWYNITLLTDYEQKLKGIEKMNSIQHFETLGVFMICAINAAASEPIEFELDAVVNDIIYDNPDTGLESFEIMMNDYQKQQNLKNAKPPAVRGKKSN